MLRAKDGHSERAIFVIDKRGIIRYIDIHDIDDQPDNEVLREVIRQIDPEAARHEPKGGPVDFSQLPRGGIVMYCTPWCPDCKRRAYVAGDTTWPTPRWKFMRPPAPSSRCGSGQRQRTTPTFDIDGQIVVDFDAARLKAVLGLEERFIEP